MGKWFLVAVVILVNEKLKIEKQLEELEYASKKHKTKWRKAKHFQREAYITGLNKIPFLKNSFYYSVYENTILFADLVAMTTAKAILDKTTGEYTASITVDGLSRNLEKRFATTIRKLKIKTVKVKGARDESSPLIRLADALAGLFRDASEGEQWARIAVSQFDKKGFSNEI